MHDTSSKIAQAAISEPDLKQFYQLFFEEAGENISSMESMLLAIDIDNPVEEDLHSIFRAAHSIKGGAATFGFQDVAELTHELETLLDRVRRHELALTTAMVDKLLEAGDALRGQLAGRQSGHTDEAGDISALLSGIRTFAIGHAVGGLKPSDGARAFDMVVGPLDDASVFESIIELFSDIPNLGSIAAIAMPVVGAENICGDGLRCFRVVTTSPEDELCDLLSFHVSRDQLRFLKADPPQVEETISEAVAKAVQKPRSERLLTGGADASTLRVSVEKVDQLINLVGELVITQAMLSNNGRDINPITHAGMLSGLADLERSVRSLQDAVMGIRMIPMAVVFNRFPRMLRDLAAKLGKEIELKTSGEATELDKGLIEKITDPLTHLIRNAVDHGIEPPEKRLASGKPASGTIYLSAAHRGGSIVIDVRDDGAGLNRDKILAKAREQGLPVHDDMTDKEVWQLIWAPGFSTAEHVTDVSGRGVGMDVVTKNIAALGGTTSLDSINGQGTFVSIQLPLTLAIMNGMSVEVGCENFIIPLTHVVESLPLIDGMLRTVVGQGRVVEVRADYLPVVALHEVFNVVAPKSKLPAKILVIIEFEGAKTALLVDKLIGQQQVVVKNLETNYRKVPGVSGATIMGDGRVALILDAASVVATGRSAAGRPAHVNQSRH